MADTPRDLSKIPGFDERPSIDPESSVALDDLLKKQETPDETPADEPVKAADEPVKAADEPAKPDSDEPVKAADEPVKAADEPVKAADEPAKPDPDELDAVQLPPYTKPKTTESFDTVKRLARERIATVTKERDDFKKQAEEAAAKNTGGVPAEVEAELKELREFRAKLDVEADPQFKAYDEQVAANLESIYVRLKAAPGFTDEHLEQIKKLGGPSEVDWESVADKMPAALRRFVESKLVENEGLLDKKNRAVADAKKNATEYLRTKGASETTARETRVKQVETSIKELAPKLGWLQERKPKDSASTEEKAAVEAHNKLVKESNDFLAEATGDDSPQLRGILAIGYVQLLKLRLEHAAQKSTHEAKVKELEGKLKEATALIDRVKKSSTTRFRESPAEGALPVAKVDDINTPGAEALDARLKEHLGQK